MNLASGTDSVSIRLGVSIGGMVESPAFLFV